MIGVWSKFSSLKFCSTKIILWLGILFVNQRGGFKTVYLKELFSNYLYPNHLGDVLNMQIPGFQPGLTQLEPLWVEPLTPDFYQISKVILLPSKVWETPF